MSTPEEAPDSPAPRQFGDYLLEELVSEDADTRTYHARQVSMDRTVILVVHKRGGRPGRQSDEAFLADARAKAAIEFAGIGSVYEAGEEEGELYWTRELLPGTTLAELHREGRKFAPHAIAGFLRQVGEAMAYLEQRGATALPLVPEHMVLGEHGIMRITNLAGAGQAAPSERVRDLAALGHTLGQLLDPGIAGKNLMGATRAERLLGMMMSTEEGIELSWGQVASTARELEQSLASEIRETEECYARAMSVRRWKVTGILTGVMLAACAVGLLLLNRPAAPEARDLSAMVEIPRGVYLDHEGKEAELERFWIRAYEVTIAEYAEFLDALARVEESMRSAYDHDTQPAAKEDHIPGDWHMVFAAARAGRTHDGLELDLNCPVTRIDWWDAYAYASWKGGELPTQQEWLAAATLEGEAPVRAGGWGPVDQLVGETPRRVHGLGGNVAEWTKNSERNPAFPMNARSPVACGGAFTGPEGGSRKRTWISNRGERRRDLGFRIVMREAQQGRERVSGKPAG